jgi:phosphotransferase system HPr-like phosphotransfer protein
LDEAQGPLSTQAQEKTLTVRNAHGFQAKPALMANQALTKLRARIKARHSLKPG